jgi:hypothetical protein
VRLVRDGGRRACGALTAICATAISRDGRGKKKEAGSASWDVGMGVVQGQPPAASGQRKCGWVEGRRERLFG